MSRVIKVTLSESSISEKITFKTIMCGISFLDNKNSFRDLVGNGSELTVLHEIHLYLVKRCVP